jgi:hypothetical protein
MKNSTSSFVVKAKKAAKEKKQQRVDWSSVTTIGIDLGDRFSSYCAIDGDGSIVAEGAFPQLPRDCSLPSAGWSRRRSPSRRERTRHG